METNIKLSKDIFLTSVNKDETEISVSLLVKANNEFNTLFFDFEEDLNCTQFKNVCKILRISQKKLKEQINLFLL